MRQEAAHAPELDPHVRMLGMEVQRSGEPPGKDNPDGQGG